MADLEAKLVGRTIVAVELDEVDDGLAIITLDDGSRLEIRTSKVGDLMLRRDS
jgi:hypothetical protein